MVVVGVLGYYHSVADGKEQEKVLHFLSLGKEQFVLATKDFFQLEFCCIRMKAMKEPYEVVSFEKKASRDEN